jgi:hypothetical protein
MYMLYMLYMQRSLTTATRPLNRYVSCQPPPAAPPPEAAAAAAAAAAGPCATALLADLRAALYELGDAAAAAAAVAAPLLLLLLPPPQVKMCTGSSVGCHAARCCLVSQLLKKDFLSCRLLRPSVMLQLCRES